MAIEDVLKIWGGIPLKGSVTVSGGKNAAVAIIPAALLADDVSYIENLPEIDDVYVLEEMLLEDYYLGGEQSGHIIFSKHARTGDGILTSLMVMEAIIEKKQTLGTLADEVKIFPQLLKNVRVKDKKTALDNAAVQAAVEKTAEELGTDGRILVRESGTEPVIRVMVEAASDEICEKYVDSVVKVIESEGLCE